MEGKTVANAYELARYPFLPNAEEYLRNMGFTLEEATADSVVARARERIDLAIKKKKVNLDLSNNDIEILSFYIAMLIIKMLANNWLIHTFARAEGERAKEAFSTESKQAVCRIMNQLFRLNLQPVERIPFVLNDTEMLKVEFAAPVVDYLKVNSQLGQIDNPKLALVNNYLYQGIIYMTRERIIDLVKDQFSSLIKKRIARVQLPTKLPEPLLEVINEYKEKIPKPKIFSSSKKFEYIENILKSNIQDGRHRILWLILPPYLVNIKHLSEDEAFEILRSYIDRIGWKEPRADRIIRYNIRRARRIGLMPPTLERLRQTHPDLYTIIVESIGRHEVS